MRLGEEEPVIVAHGEGHVGPLEMRQGRDDVQDAEPLDPLGMVQRQAVATRAPRSWPATDEALMPEVPISATRSRAISRLA